MKTWNIQFSGTASEIWVHHIDETPGMIDAHMFVGRFKYHAPKRSANKFVKFLKENFTPEEFFAAREVKDASGKVIQQLAPLMILKAKGFISYNEEYARKMQGFKS